MAIQGSDVNVRVAYSQTGNKQVIDEMNRVANGLHNLEEASKRTLTSERVLRDGTLELTAAKKTETQAMDNATKAAEKHSNALSMGDRMMLRYIMRTALLTYGLIEVQKQLADVVKITEEHEVLLAKDTSEKYDTLAFKTMLLNEQWRQIKLTLGEGVLPALKGFADVMSSFILPQVEMLGVHLHNIWSYLQSGQGFGKSGLVGQGIASLIVPGLMAPTLQGLLMGKDKVAAERDMVRKEYEEGYKMIAEDRQKAFAQAEKDYEEYYKKLTKHHEKGIRDVTEKVLREQERMQIAIRKWREKSGGGIDSLWAGGAFMYLPTQAGMRAYGGESQTLKQMREYYAALGDEAQKYLDTMKAKFQWAKDAFSGIANVLAQGLTAQFKSFKDFLGALYQEILRIIQMIIAKMIMFQFLNLLFPGMGLAKGGWWSGFGKFLGLGGGTSSVPGGGGRGGGGIQMTFNAPVFGAENLGQYIEKINQKRVF